MLVASLCRRIIGDREHEKEKSCNSDKRWLMDAKRTGVRGCMRSCATTSFFSNHDRRLAVLRSVASYTAGDHRVKIASLMTSSNDIIIIVTATVTTTVKVACSNPDILRNLIII
jgi:hypothetical protein